MDRLSAGFEYILGRFVKTMDSSQEPNHSGYRPILVSSLMEDKKMNKIGVENDEN